jgi:hypothetical protein
VFAEKATRFKKTGEAKTPHYFVFSLKTAAQKISQTVQRAEQAPGRHLLRANAEQYRTKRLRHLRTGSISST